MSTVARYRYCPVCRSEYTLMATRCIDCEVDLVDESELAALEQDFEAFPPASELECVRVAPLPWIRALSEALQRDGIAHRVEPATPGDAPEDQRPDVFGNVQLFGLYLRSPDLSPAREIDGSIAGRLLPEEAPALADGEEEVCPACGTPLSPDGVECPDCGLRFG